MEPGSKRHEDIQAAERRMQFVLGWYAHPIFSSSGDYPPVMKSMIFNRSKAEHVANRLPQFTQAEINSIKGNNTVKSRV